MRGAIALKSLKMTSFSKTGSRNMAETCAINFLTLVSYSTSIVTWGLRRLLLAVLLWAGAARNGVVQFWSFFPSLIAHGVSYSERSSMVVDCPLSSYSFPAIHLRRSKGWVAFLCKGAERDEWRGPKGRANALAVVVLWRKEDRAARPVGPSRRTHFWWHLIKNAKF